MFLFHLHFAFDNPSIRTSTLLTSALSQTLTPTDYDLTYNNMPYTPSPTRGEGKKNLASRYLEAIGTPSFSPGSGSSPLKPTPSLRLNRTDLRPSQSLAHSHISNLKENENPFKSPKKTTFSAMPDSPVKRLIMQKEQAAVVNNATDFLPMPATAKILHSPVKFTGFKKTGVTTTTTFNAENSLSKSEIKTMNTAMSNSPSLKNLNKLKNIEGKLMNPTTVRKVSGIRTPRLHLPKDLSYKNLNRNAMDMDRRTLLAMDYICRLSELKRWIEQVLEIEIDLKDDNIVDFQEYLRNGILLAMITQKFEPGLVKRIYYGLNNDSQRNFKNKSGLYFKFTENIVAFLTFLKKLHVPDMFIFETTDLFEMKNFPKVVFCLHALSCILNITGRAPNIEKLTQDDIEVSKDDIKQVQSKIRGIKMPNFDNIDDGVRVNVGLDIIPLTLVENEEERFVEEIVPPTLVSKSQSPHASFEEPVFSLEKTSTVLEESIVEEEESEEEDSYVDPIKSPEYSEPAEKTESIDMLSSGSGDSTFTVSDNIDQSWMTEDVINQTREARDLFKARDDRILDIDIDAIENKYASMILHDNGLSINPLTDDTYQNQPTAGDDNYLESLIELQALARGSLVRYELFINRFMIKVFTPNIITLQSIIRGNSVRARRVKTQRVLTENWSSVSVLQAIVKNRTKEDKYARVKKELSEKEDTITELQSVLRGLRLRNELKNNKKLLTRQTAQITQVQGLVRGTLFRKSKDEAKYHDPNYDSRVLPDLPKRELTRIKKEKKSKKVKKVKKEKKEQKRKPPIDLAQFEKVVTSLQSVVRGGILRNRLNNYIDEIYDNRKVFKSLAAMGKGALVRRNFALTKKYLQKNRGSVKVIQSTFRGALTRFYVEDLLEELEYQTPRIVGLQSIIRAGFVREKIRQRDAWFRRPANVAKIIKIQSYFRASRAANDFKSLINERNPPLKAVKNFIGLLSGSDVEVEDELNIEKYKEQIVQETKRIEKWEQDLNQLGVKLQLLKKNKISLEEVIKFKDDHLSLSEYSHNLNDNLNRSLSSNPNKVLADKSVSSLSKLYGKLFFLLQTKPFYLGNLLNCMDLNGFNVELSHGNIEDWILKVFNYGIVSVDTSIAASREEFLLMKLILSSAFQFFETIPDIQKFKKFMRGRQSLENKSVKHWEILLSGYINLPQHRYFVKSFFGDCILRVTGDEDSWYEANPAMIFKDLLERDEAEGRISLKSIDDLKTMDPIEDPETRDQFVSNLTNLREACYDIMKRIGKSIDNLPVFIRCICKELYVYLKRSYPGEPERFYLSSIGTIFMRSYIIPMFTNPENYGVHLSTIKDPERTRNNLIEVAKVLNQLVLMRPFGSSNVYLQPLNPFLEEFIEGVREMMKQLIDIETIDECYQMSSAYYDVSSNVKPVLKLSSDEILEVLELVKNEIDISAPEKNDYLRYVMFEINELVGSAHNKLGRGIIDLILEPVAESSDSNDVEIRALMLEAKRYIIYILQIQDGEDLLDLLLSEITPMDEFKFKEIAKSENKKIVSSNIESAFEREALNEIFNSTFPQVKKKAIEIILDLEKLGALTRSNGYQELLNEIAFDIKTKRTQKEERERQFRIVIDTLTKLKQKERTCSKVYSSYIKDIDNAMYKLQSNSLYNHQKKPLFSRLFSKQYYYQRELKKKKGYLPKFGGYRYSSKYLMDHKILVDFKNIGSNRSSFRSSKIQFTFSCDKIGEFIIGLTNGEKDVTEKVSLDDLLYNQYEQKKKFKLFDGCVVFDTDYFSAFIFRKFYEVEKAN